LQVHAVGLERAFITLAVDVGNVVPDLSVESVLELTDGARNRVLGSDLDGHAALRWGLIAFAVAFARSYLYRSARSVIGGYGPEVDWEGAFVVDNGVGCLHDRSG